MIYSFEFDKLPIITETYIITRKTVWEITDAHHILIIILEGSCCFELDSKTYVIKKGESFFVPSNKLYKRFPFENQKCRMIYIHFQLNSEMNELTNIEAFSSIEENRKKTELSLINKDAIFFTAYTLYLKNHMQGNATLNQLIGNMQICLKKINLENSLNIVLCLCNILAELSKTTINTINEKNAEKEVVTIPANLKKAILYIRQNIHTKISIPDLSKHCNLSQSQLTRYFKNAFGKTPGQYINEYKLNRAKFMLMNMPQLSVRVIAETVGFDDQQYFSKLFSKVFNEPPTAYRYRVTHHSEKHDIPVLPRSF